MDFLSDTVCLVCGDEVLTWLEIQDEECTACNEKMLASWAAPLDTNTDDINEVDFSMDFRNGTSLRLVAMVQF